MVHRSWRNRISRQHSPALAPHSRQATLRHSRYGTHGRRRLLFAVSVIEGKLSFFVTNGLQSRKLDKTDR
jgi:hypothetical protein